MRKMLLIPLALLVAPATVQAADWVQISSDKSGSDWYIDSASVRPQGDRMSVWIKLDHSRNSKTKARVSRFMEKFDCANWTSRTISWIDYDAGGDVLEANSFPDYTSNVGYDPIPPDTVLNRVATLVCKQ